MVNLKPIPPTRIGLAMCSRRVSPHHSSHFEPPIREVNFIPVDVARIMWWALLRGVAGGGCAAGEAHGAGGCGGGGLRSSTFRLNLSAFCRIGVHSGIV
jgi:hypothetical protein